MIIVCRRVPNFGLPFRQWSWLLFVVFFFLFLVFAVMWLWCSLVIFECSGIYGFIFRKKAPRFNSIRPICSFFFPRLFAIISKTYDFVLIFKKIFILFIHKFFSRFSVSYFWCFEGRFFVMYEVFFVNILWVVRSWWLVIFLYYFIKCKY